MTAAPDNASGSTPGNGDPIAVILARMEVKLDNALTEISRHGTAIEKADSRIDAIDQDIAVFKSADLPNRVGLLEQNRWKQSGAIAFVSALLASGVVGLSVDILSRH